MALVPEDTASTTPATAPPPSALMPVPAKVIPTEVSPTSPEPTPAVIAPRTSRWSNLPLRDHPTCTCHQVKCYSIVAMNNESSKDETAGPHRAYITFEETEPKTYHEAKSSTCLKQWEEAIATEYSTLCKTGTFEWVLTLPKG